MEMWVKVLHSICNMGTRGLPHMYTLSPRACGPRAPGAHTSGRPPVPMLQIPNVQLKGE